MQATACYNTLNEDANFDGNHPHRQHHPHHQHQKLHREKVDEERTGYLLLARKALVDLAEDGW